MHCALSTFGRLQENLDNLIAFNAGNVFWASFAFFCIFVGDNILQKFFPELNDLKQFFKLSICF